jgi:hypothetical protein
VKNAASGAMFALAAQAKQRCGQLCGQLNSPEGKGLSKNNQKHDLPKIKFI